MQISYKRCNDSKSKFCDRSTKIKHTSYDFERWTDGYIEIHRDSDFDHATYCSNFMFNRTYGMIHTDINNGSQCPQRSAILDFSGLPMSQRDFSLKKPPKVSRELAATSWPIILNG